MSVFASYPSSLPTAEPGLASIDPRIDSLRVTVTRLARQLRNHSAAELTPTQLSALDSLGRQGRIRVGRLAKIEGISKPISTRLTGKLQDMGLVERIQDDADAPSWQVALTPEGKYHLSGASRKADEFLGGKISGLSRDDQQRLLEALPTLLRLWDVKA